MRLKTEKSALNWHQSFSSSKLTVHNIIRHIAGLPLLDKPFIQLLTQEINSRVYQVLHIQDLSHRVQRTNWA